MSKAEEKALAKYPVRSVLIVPARGGGYYADSHLREGFVEGYREAEKDLELTWQDIKKIYHLVNEVSDDLGIKAMYVNIYQEALKRYKNLKK